MRNDREIIAAYKGRETGPSRKTLRDEGLAGGTLKGGKMDKPFELGSSIAGAHIETVSKDAVQLADLKHHAVQLADLKHHAVHFEFNGTDVIVQPGETSRAVQERWQKDFDAAREAWLASPEYRKREEERAAEEKRKMEAHLSEPAQTEKDMRAAKVPWPYTLQQLNEYIESLVNREHDYGTCVYTMSMAAEAAFNYVSHQLGVTGFQASCADLDFLRRTRRMEGPFIILKAEDLLYPQYDLREKLEEFIHESSGWVKDEAKKKLAEVDCAHPNVKARWESLAK